MSQRRAHTYNEKGFQKLNSPNPKKFKRYTTYPEFFESQDIWKNLDRIRHYTKDAEKPIKSSIIFIPLDKSVDYNSVKLCLKQLHEYLNHGTLQLYGDEGTSGSPYIVLRNFCILDCCLALTVLFNMVNQNKMKKQSSDYFLIPKDAITFNGRFYMTSNSTWFRNAVVQNYKQFHSNVKMIASQINKLSGFNEYFVSSNSNKVLTYFINNIAEFIMQVKFGKHSRRIENSFLIAENGYNKSLELKMSETPLTGNALLDVSLLSENAKLIGNTESNLSNFKLKLDKYNKPQEQLALEEKQLRGHNAKLNSGSNTQQSANITVTGTPMHGTSTIPTYKDQSRFGQLNQSQSGRPGYLTQEEIKEHCIANLKASKGIVSTKSPYQIFKMYIKVPKLKYIDMVYQNLNDLRSKTNCNIVVLNLNNLHESEPWFASLDLSNYTNIVQHPHPSTVRVVSIGGVSEYIITALDLIASMMENQ